MSSAGLRSAMLAALLAGAGGGAAAQDVFTVANYPVEGRADNAVAAKDRALVEGQQAAFRSLLKRLVSVTAYSHIARLKDFRAGDLIEGVKVRSERNSTTEYFANLDFSFQAKAVRDLLRREGIAFTDAPAPVVTVIPLMMALADQLGPLRGFRADALSRWKPIAPVFQVKTSL